MYVNPINEFQTMMKRGQLKRLQRTLYGANYVHWADYYTPELAVKSAQKANEDWGMYPIIEHVGPWYIVWARYQEVPYMMQKWYGSFVKADWGDPVIVEWE